MSSENLGGEDHLVVERGHLSTTMKIDVLVWHTCGRTDEFLFPLIPQHTQDMAAHLYPVLSPPPYDGSPPPEQSAGRMVKGLQSGQTNVHKVQ